MNPTLTLIAALDDNRAIGRDNTLPWQLPEDLKRFKAKTMGKPLLMGRKTAESLGRALPGRLNLVLTRQGQAPFPGMVACATVEEALAHAKDVEEVMVIGGGDIYTLALPHASRLLLTHVHTSTDNADAFFPDFDPAQWVVTSEEHRAADDRHAMAFSFVDYERRA